jgi:hypothetical protein
MGIPQRHPPSARITVSALFAFKPGCGRLGSSSGSQQKVLPGYREVSGALLALRPGAPTQVRGFGSSAAHLEAGAGLRMRPHDTCGCRVWGRRRHVCSNRPASKNGLWSVRLLATTGPPQVGPVTRCPFLSSVQWGEDQARGSRPLLLAPPRLSRHLFWTTARGTAAAG